MSLNYKKSRLVENMGYNQVLPTFYGKTPQNIRVTEAQFKRLVENYMEDEDKLLREMNFGDEDGDNLPSDVNFHDDNFDPAPEESINELELDLHNMEILPEPHLEKHLKTHPDELGDFTPGDGADDESFDGHHFKHDVIGAYDPDFSKLSREGDVYEDEAEEDVYEDSEDRETRNYGRDESHDKRIEDDLEQHLESLRGDMGYDQHHEWSR